MSCAGLGITITKPLNPCRQFPIHQPISWVRDLSVSEQEHVEAGRGSQGPPMADIKAFNFDHFVNFSTPLLLPTTSYYFLLRILHVRHQRPVHSGHSGRHPHIEIERGSRSQDVGKGFRLAPDPCRRLASGGQRPRHHLDNAKTRAHGVIFGCPIP